MLLDLLYSKNTSADTGEEGKKGKDKLPSGHRTRHPKMPGRKFIFLFFPSSPVSAE